MPADELMVLIREFILRQEIVYEAMMELRPDKFAIADKRVSDLELLEIVKKYMHVPGRGIWQRYGTWKYFLHGGGCRLTNIITGEPLEWDAPDKAVFDRDWFVNWCMWLSKINVDYSGLSQDKLYEMLKKLENDKMIEWIDGSKLRLVTPNSEI